jgi:hypothetical protein
MAVFQLGAGITGLVGSSGGTTFKRNKGTNVWMNKSRGPSRSRNLQNKRLINNAVIFRSWSLLSDAAKDGWNANAAAYKVKDKFGNDVNISGVAFQRKCNLSAALLNLSNIEWYNFTTNLNGIVITACTINWAGENFNINLESTDGSSTSYACIMLEFTLNVLNAPQFIRRGVFQVVEIPGSTSANLYTTMMAQFPFLNTNYSLRVYAFEVNDSGWTGVQTFSNVTTI